MSKVIGMSRKSMGSRMRSLLIPYCQTGWGLQTPFVITRNGTDPFGLRIGLIHFI